MLLHEAESELRYFVNALAAAAARTRYCCEAVSDALRAGLATSGLREELDLFDRVRRLLVNERDFDLPGIVVVGNTSVGKSSVLESISGVEFSTGAGVTTTCPIRLILRDGSAFAATVDGVNTPDKSMMARHILAAMTQALKNRSASESRSTPGFAGKVIEVELHEPGLPDLTLLDLPGIVNSGASKEFVKRLIQEHIERELALGAAKDFFWCNKCCSD